jgi:pimeloyl-ACP methyl ester carboxylesterase
VNKRADLNDYTKQVVKMLQEPGRKDALYAFLWESKQVCADRIGSVECPVLVLIGDKDPDFSNPSEEAQWIESAFKKDLVTYQLLPDCGHYPHIEYVDVAWTEIESFLGKKVLIGSDPTN